MGKKVLFVNQEIMPYVPETEMSVYGSEMPHVMQEAGYEIRTFMPRWGNINERRGQLHEVIRLSGMNLIIDDTDHPLIIMTTANVPSSLQEVCWKPSRSSDGHRISSTVKGGCRPSFRSM